MIGTDRRTPEPRSIDSVTVEPFGPRMRSRAPCMVSPSSDMPSTDRTTSPASSPARSAGEPDNGLVTTSRQAAPSGVQPSVPSGASVAISAPMPSNWPLMPCRFSRYCVELRYSEYGSPSDLIMPSIAPLTSAPRSTSPPAYRSLIVW